MKEYNYFIDTNVFLRTLLKDEKRTFGDCLRFFKEIKNRNIKAVTSNLVLAEINWTLLKFYKFSKEDVIRGLNSILSLGYLKFVDNFNANAAIKFYKDYQVKFIDALISSIPGISNGKIKIVSYDKDFDKLGVSRLEPKDIISTLKS